VLLAGARVLLAVVFAVAGIAKLGDRQGVLRMVADFGSPARLAAPLAGALVGCELGVAAALGVSASARAGGLAALVLLAGFSAAISLNVAHGRHPACHCFGRLQSAEVGWPAVARNAVLAAAAAFVAAGGRFMPVLAALAVLAAGAWLGLEPRKPRPLRAGAPAPGFSLADPAGRRRTLDSLLARGRPLLLIFGDSACGACQELMPQVARWQEGLGGKITIAVVSAGPAEDHRAAAREHGLRGLLADEDGAVTADYGITVTPSAVLVGAGPAIAAATAAGASEITALVARVTAGGLAVAGRRALLKRVVAGAAAVTVVPLLASACASARSVRHAMRPGQLKIGGAWLCDQRYALCTSAACEPSKTNPKVSVCRCTVMTGYSAGFKTCEQRAPAGRHLHSNFSLQAVTSSTRVMTCSEPGLWVQCLDAVCEADPANPGHALCQCVNMKTKNFLTFAGNCDTRTCASVIWSAATQPFPGGAQYEKGLQRLGIPYRVPKGCPASARSS
jgi:peroxiredoxin